MLTNKNFKFYIPIPLKDTIGVVNDKWLESLPTKFEYLRNRIGFIPSRIEDSSRFGLVIYGIYNDSECVIKIVPDGKKSDNEILFWKNNKYPFMIPIYYIDPEEHVYIMKKGHVLQEEKNIITRFNNVKKIFETVMSSNQPIVSEVEFYDCKLKERYLKLKNESRICGWIELAINRLETIENIYDSELLHGDIRYSNIVSSDEGLLHAIDPLGINGPKLMEFTRYIEDEIFNCSDFEQFENRINILLDLFGDMGINRMHLLDAIFVDSILRTSSSFILNESNEIIGKGINNAIWLDRIIKGSLL